MYKVYKQRQTGLKVQGGRSKRREREIEDPQPSHCQIPVTGKGQLEPGHRDHTSVGRKDWDQYGLETEANYLFLWLVLHSVQLQCML